MYGSVGVWGDGRIPISDFGFWILDYLSCDPLQ